MDLVTQSQSQTTASASRRVQVLHKPVDLSSIGDLDVVSVLPSVPDWRDWFGTSRPHLAADEPLARRAAYARAMGDLAKFVLSHVKPGPGMTLTIASPLALDGRSTVAANLALACANQNKRVLLIDSDLHRHALDGLFTTSARQLGISNVLTGSVYWRDLAVPLQFHPTLQFMPAGTAGVGNDLPRAPLADMLNEAKPFYDLILLDSAPLLQHTQTIDLVAASDATLLLARRSHTRQSELVSALGYLRRMEARVLAIALNDA